MSKSSKNINKINLAQRKILAEFMVQHPDLARNILTSTGEGKIKANRLWAYLKVKLNAAGPPHKDAQLWRKVFRDIKHHIKKKVFEERCGVNDLNLTNEDRKIMQAAGLDLRHVKEKIVVPAVQENEPAIENFFTITELKTDIKSEEPYYTSDTPEENDEVVMLDHDNNSFVVHNDNTISDADVEAETDITSMNTNMPPDLKKDCVMSMLNDKLTRFLQNQSDLNGKLDKLLEMNERFLEMKEEEHTANMALKNLELKIKTMEFEMLKSKLADSNSNTSRI